VDLVGAVRTGDDLLLGPARVQDQRPGRRRPHGHARGVEDGAQRRVQHGRADEERDRGGVRDLDAELGDGGRDRRPGREDGGVHAEHRPVAGADTGDAAALDDDVAAARTGHDPPTGGHEVGGELVDERRQLDPALARVEDGAVVRDGGDVDARGAVGDLLRRQPLGGVADLPHVLVGGAVAVDLAGSRPGQAAVEPEVPGGVDLGGERPVPVQAEQPETVVLRRPGTVGVQPGQRAPGGPAGQCGLGEEGDRGSPSRQLRGGGDPEDPAADDGDAGALAWRSHERPRVWELMLGKL
jgi:hypothetical protein